MSSASLLEWSPSPWGDRPTPWPLACPKTDERNIELTRPKNPLAAEIPSHVEVRHCSGREHHRDRKRPPLPGRAIRTSPLVLRSAFRVMLEGPLVQQGSTDRLLPFGPGVAANLGANWCPAVPNPMANRAQDDTTEEEIMKLCNATRGFTVAGLQRRRRRTVTVCTFVYVYDAEDGDIGSLSHAGHRLTPARALVPRPQAWYGDVR